MSNYVLELNAEQIEPVIAAALKDSIIDQLTWAETDEKLLKSLYTVLRYFTTQSEYDKLRDEITESVAEQTGE